MLVCDRLYQFGLVSLETYSAGRMAIGRPLLALSMLAFVTWLLYQDKE